MNDKIKKNEREKLLIVQGSLFLLYCISPLMFITVYLMLSYPVHPLVASVV